MINKIAPQLDQLFEKMGACMLPDDHVFNGSSKLVSLLFGYKLVDLALVSLCVTVRTKGLLPKDVLTQHEEGGASAQARLLFDYGLLDVEVYEKVVRILNAKPEINLELVNLSNSFPMFDELLSDVSEILKSTETVVSELCDTGPHVEMA